MIIRTSPYYLLGNKEEDNLKTYGATELAILRGFVRDVLETITYDDTGVTDDLYDSALRAAEVLGIVDVNRLDDDWTPEEERKIFPQRGEDE